MLRPNLADHPVSDFHQWLPWRPLVVATTTKLALHRAASHCPQTILTCAYLAQIFAGLREAGLRVLHVLLDADEEILRQRIRASRSWMIPAADVVVDTGRWTPSSAAHQIADALPGL
jgi:hypothetical protein